MTMSLLLTVTLALAAPAACAGATWSTNKPCPPKPRFRLGIVTANAAGLAGDPRLALTQHSFASDIPRDRAAFPQCLLE